MDHLGVGIVGTGIMARTHATVLDAYHRSTVAGWVSRSPGEREAGRPVFGSVQELVDGTDVQAVLIATPDHAHTAPVLEAIAAGKHVLVEKPLATTAEDARRIRDAATAAGVTAMTLFNHRWVPAYWQVHDQIAGRRPVLAYARKNDTIGIPTEMITWADRTTPSFFLSSHDLDLLLWYFDDRVVSVTSVATHGVLQGLGVDTPDAVQAQLRFDGGAIATLEACWVYPDTFPTMTDSFLELVFADSVVHVDRKREAVEIATADRFSYPRNQLSGMIAGRPAGSVAAAVQHFVDCALDGSTPLVTMDSSVRVTEILCAIDDSWRTGTTIQLDDEGSPT